MALRSFLDDEPETQEPDEPDTLGAGPVEQQSADSGWTNEMLEGLSTSDKLGLIGRALSGEDLSPLRKEYMKVSETRRKETHMQDVGRRIQEAGEDPDKIAGVLAEIRDPALMRLVLPMLEGARKQTRRRKGAAQARERLEGTGGVSMTKQAAMVFALEMVEGDVLDPAGVKPVAEFLAKGNFKVQDMGVFKRLYREDNPKEYFDWDEETNQIVGGTLFRLERGKVVGVEAYKPETITLPAEHGGVVEKPRAVAPRLQGQSLLPPESLAPPVPGQVVPAAGIVPAQAPQPQAPQPQESRVLVPPSKPRNKIGDADAGLLSSIGMGGKLYYDEMSKEEGQQLLALRRGEGVKPTGEQAEYLTRLNVPTNLSWDQIRVKYPNAADQVAKLRDRNQDEDALRKIKQQRELLASLPYVAAFPTAAKRMYSVEQRVHDPNLSINDMLAKKAILLDPESGRAVDQMNAVLPAMVRLVKAAEAVLAVSPGENLINALKLAVQRGLASSTDLAEFDALRGVIGLQTAVAIQGSRPSDTDAQAIHKGFPTDTDTVRAGVAKLRALIRMLNDSVDARLGKPMPPLQRKELDRLINEDAPLGSPKPGGGRFKRAF